MAHLVFIEETKELSRRGGLKDRLVRRILMGRDLEGSGNQLTFCSEGQLLQMAAGSTKWRRNLGREARPGTQP